MKRGAKVGGDPKRVPPREPFQKRAESICKELDRVRQVGEQQVAKVKKDCRVLVEAAQEAQFRAECELGAALLSRADVAKLYIAMHRGWLGRVWYRLCFFFTGRVA